MTTFKVGTPSVFIPYLMMKPAGSSPQTLTKNPGPKTWGAFVDTCRDLGIPAAVERSRSGNGAHVWFFFSTPVPAVRARRMGCYLITKTMSRRHQLAMSSYDRLFPNQDTLPRGGFGNLIALPLQYEPRQTGNSSFLDENFHPQPDQWSYLASLSRIAPSIVESIARDATQQEKIIGVRFASTNEEEKDDTPWERPPCGRPERASITDPVPNEVHAVLAQRLFVDKTDLPSALINQIKRLAAFQNPEFYKKQGMRLSTALTPRVISCAEEFSRHIALPRGCLDVLADLLQQYSSTLTLEDQRHLGESLDVRFYGKLTAIQQQAVNTLCKHEIGVFVAPPGTGKTVVGAWLTAERKRNTLILVQGRSPILLTERKEHLEHFAKRLQGFARNLILLQGGRSHKKRRNDLNRLAAIPDNEERLVLATGRYIGEGFDDARLDTLFLALPVSWKGTLIQYAGRLHRLHPDKTEVHIYDYVDRNVPMLARMFERRLRGYRAIGYSAEEIGTHL